MTAEQRADLYALLAELLAEPADWMSRPGREWPLFDSLTQLGAESAAARHSLDLVAGLPAEGLDQRRERYAALFAAGRPRFWLYESAARTGKLLGASTFELAKLYRAAGLEVNSAELPDHASLELAFLSHLVGQISNLSSIAEQTDALSYEKQFLAAHGDWLIDLGRALQKSGDTVYAVIGGLLADWLTEALTPTHLPREGQGVRALPTLPRPDDCTLCGFCAQVCPTRALKVLEDRRETILALTTAECIHCGKCERICDFKVLKMGLPLAQTAPQEILRRSPLVICPKCGKPIASQAEMDYIVSQIGDAAWQRLCLDCRASLYV